MFTRRGLLCLLCLVICCTWSLAVGAESGDGTFFSWECTTAGSSSGNTPIPPGEISNRRLLPSGTDLRPSACPASQFTRRTVSPTTSSPYMTVGKILVDGTWNHIASGAVVGRNVVLTAGHVTAENGAWYDPGKMIFIPGYDNGAEPYGRWEVTKACTFSQWKDDGWNCADVAFLTLKPKNGQYIGDVVGYLGFMTGHDVDQTYYQYGYPANGNLGHSLIEVISGYGDRDWLEGGVSCHMPVGVGNDMDEGCSGGPWLVRSSGSYYAAGLNAYSYQNWCADTQYSPYFGEDVQILYDHVISTSVESDGCPDETLTSNSLYFGCFADNSGNQWSCCVNNGGDHCLAYNEGLFTMPRTIDPACVASASISLINVNTQTYSARSLDYYLGVSANARSTGLRVLSGHRVPGTGEADSDPLTIDVTDRIKTLGTTGGYYFGVLNDDVWEVTVKNIVLTVTLTSGGGGGGGGDDDSGDGAKGEISFTLTWTHSGSSRSEGPDLDLWVSDPNTYMLSSSREGYGLGPTPNGGRIDFDDLGGWGDGDGGGPERAYWPEGQADEGLYLFGYRYFQGDGTANYTLTVYTGSTVYKTYTGQATRVGGKVTVGAMAY